MRRMLVVLVLGALLAMLIAGGVALAAEPEEGTCITVHNDLTGEDNALWCKGTPSSDTLIGAPTGDRLEGLAGKDKLYGLGGIDALYGNSDNDDIFGDNPPEGYTGDVGPANWDALFGGTGNDHLRGNAGVDVLYAGNDSKRDILDGGKEADVYVVKEDAYVVNPPTRMNTTGLDVIYETESLGDGTALPSGATAEKLHNDALGGGPHLYFYP